MKTRHIFFISLLLTGVNALAQETYENATVATQDLNGTARYVGMGGALDALGADISTISSNPAGIGLFRRNRADVSFGMVSQQDAADYSRGNKTNMSFDQVGIVYSKRNGEKSFVNVGFNYHKSRNFDYILSAADRLQNASQNKLTYVKLWNNLLYRPGFDEGTFDLDNSYSTCNQIDDIYMRNLLYAAGDGNAYFYEANDYAFDRAQKGYVGEYDFNLSGNINDQIYLGITFGIYDVHYRHAADYSESMVANPENINQLYVYDSRKITGQGFDVKVGAIFRPVEDSPFRFGVSIATPTFYDLKTSNYTEVSDGAYTAYAEDSYSFKIYTPWKFGLSLGHTIGNKVALGAGYEYADYSSMDTRVKTGGYYDYYWGVDYEDSESDELMNEHTKRTLKGVSTLKIGAEVKPTPELSIRAGYNYVSPMYNKDGYKDGTIDSPGTYYSSATDYTNWDDTNRFTCGLGYQVGKVNLDLTYQYSSTSGDFSPFTSYVDNNYVDLDNVVNAQKVDNKRHQLLFTLGYSF